MGRQPTASHFFIFFLSGHIYLLIQPDKKGKYKANVCLSALALYIKKTKRKIKNADLNHQLIYGSMQLYAYLDEKDCKKILKTTMKEDECIKHPLKSWLGKWLETFKTLMKK